MTRTHSVIPSIALLAFLALSLAGCDAGDGSSVDDAAVEVRISGSGTTRPLMRLLTDAYPGDDVDFVYLPGLHSGGGVTGVAEGSLDIGLVSRGLTEDEQRHGLDLRVLSTDALAVAVHPTVGVESLTTAQVREIYAGNIRDWADLGGPDLAITVLDRTEDESARVVLREHVLGAGLSVTDEVVVLFYEADMIEGVVSTPGAIGYFSYGDGVSSDADVGYVALDGVSPSVDAVVDGTYEMTRELGFVMSSEASPRLKAFADWAASAEAQAILAEGGFAPHTGG